MSERKPCVRCGRSIDAVARICPFCNWMQDEAVPPPAPVVAAAEPAYVPPADLRWRKPVFGAVGAVLLLVLSFVIGAHVHGRNPPVVPKDATAAASAPSKPVARLSPNVTLVPDNEPMPAAGMPITSAPAETPQQGVANEYNRTDATAASSAEYAQMAARAAAENAAKKKTPAIVDPRMISGSAYGQEPPVRRTAVLRQRMSGEASQIVRTPPVPEYQPMPQLRLRQNATARIEVTVGTDGRVHEVNVLQPIPGETARLIAAVQMWRFRPAMQNGVPVPSSFSTAISFHANE